MKDQYLAENPSFYGEPVQPPCSEQLNHEFQRLNIKNYHKKDNIAFGIYLRFGSLTDDSRALTSYDEIRYYTGIPQASMVRLIQKWRRHGKDINRFPMTITRDRWPLTQEMEQWATSSEVLQEMISDSLLTRARKIKERFQLKSFSDYSVRTLHKKYKIGYKRPQLAYQRKQANKQSVFEK